MSILILYNLLKGLDIKSRIVFTAILIVISLILVNVICSIGQAGLAQEIRTNAKSLIVYTMLPVNILLMASPIAIQINRLKLEDIEKDKFIRNIIICLIIYVVLIVL